MKRSRRGCLFTLALVVGVFCAVLFAGRLRMGRNGLEHALNLDELPDSVAIRKCQLESWTDYLFEAEISIDPDQITNLLQGRDFARKEDHYLIGRMPETYRIKPTSDFMVAEVWVWKWIPESGADNTVPHGAPACTVTIDAERNHACIVYMSD